MHSDLCHICYYVSGTLSSRGDLSYRVHRLGSLQFRNGYKILFQVLLYNFFLFYVFCTLFKLFLEDKISHFFVGKYDSALSVYFLSASEMVMYH